ncbi:hypothetical protein K227x_52000 [Rubripirellula lacrimiformis]|uniref:Glycoside hydrolase family 38 N-terminal domain-containing protein n=1 Tax=Rubripirellula lacrimiformis TaxID=1930273 RepID=A0A517NI27_9BACT|nr:hypothetical protein [Rubripirellula lacrimiformis]QDT06784.1 hypothetical protein K227x_52000 [Rubripirellula lacrimiformis]
MPVVDDPSFDECCLLIPASTLEDFPVKLSDDDARSLLAAWTVLWHPRLLAQTEQTPAWYRADSPPDPIGRRMIVVPEPSGPKVPDEYRQRAIADPDCQWITGRDRTEMVAAMGLQPCPDLFDDAQPTPISSGLSGGDAGQSNDSPSDSASAAAGEADNPAPAISTASSQPTQNQPAQIRQIGVQDFYAAGYASLQIQVMTRRLRYTSNLDEIHLQTCLINAAKAFVDGRAEAAIEAMHEVFDLLAEERDHYFTSDPHLVDLTLVTESTLTTFLDHWSQHGDQYAAAKPGDTGSDEGRVLSTPSNLLADAEALDALARRARDAGTDPSLAESASEFRRQLAAGQIGWAAGGPPSDLHLDTMTLVQAQDAVKSAFAQATEAVGAAPPVYGRLAGATPSDMTATIAGLGYRGIIPIDFAGGTGHGEEAKVILQTGGVEIEALTAKPIDAASDASFLGLGARMGEAIDSGEIATALLVHWPGQGCDSFHDLRRIGSWSVSLGRFWRLDRYFIDGEHPYHHGSVTATSADSANLLDNRVDAKLPDPISGISATFCGGITSERDATIAAMTTLVTGKPIAQDPIARDPITRDPIARDPITRDAVAAGKDSSGDDASTAFAGAVGAVPADAGPARLLINAHSIGLRGQVLMKTPIRSAPHVFAASTVSGGTAVTADVPACGFALLRPGNFSGKATARSWLRNKWLGNPTSIADGGRLQNEFLEATIHPDSGGISGVYSGAARGNRFSLRLAAVGVTSDQAEVAQGEQSAADVQPTMRCDRLRVVDSDMAKGVIEASGSIVDAAGQTVSTFRLEYTLLRGSRVIQVRGEVDPKVTWSDDPWRSYVAVRVAVSSDASICRVMLRDKVHRASGRRLVSPLGLLIDEADRQTMIGARGHAFHRRVDERFFDTLISVSGESNHSFALDYGFDVTNPVAVSKSMIAPPVEVGVDAGDKVADIGWIVHVSPKDLLLGSLDVFRQSDGKLAAMVRVIQTRPKSCKAKLRFFRDVESARVVSSPSDGDGDADSLKTNGDQVTLPMASHGVADVLVVFQD